MTFLTRLGRKTPSRNLHERRNLHEVAEGDRTVTSSLTITHSLVGVVFLGLS
jgi:hypothetical protein